MLCWVSKFQQTFTTDGLSLSRRASRSSAYSPGLAEPAPHFVQLFHTSLRAEALQLPAGLAADLVDAQEVIHDAVKVGTLQHWGFAVGCAAVR